MGRIEFFKLNGTLNKEEDLQFSVEVFENGKFKEELLQTWDAHEISYKESFISFGINKTEEDYTVKLINGVPSGLATTYYPTNMTTSSFSKLINGKVTLQKNKPMYLVAWLGTTKNGLSSGGAENGELPPGIEETELAFIYKVVWTGKEKK